MEGWESNQLLYWSSDGALAIFGFPGGESMEIHPTRYEGWKYTITKRGSDFSVTRMRVAACGSEPEWQEVERMPGPLTLEQLEKLKLFEGRKLVSWLPPQPGAAGLRAQFLPRKRFAEHRIEIRDAAGKQVAELPVPVWCVSSCVRDEDWQRWTATVQKRVMVADRALFVLRMDFVCNGGQGKTLSMQRVIASPGNEPRPRHGRCRGL
ncbi:MAG: hypothetical protein JNJ46_20965 [Myxococcales bacterium]|nr:hypothetical protein [Myxococcales bacterium]